MTLVDGLVQQLSGPVHDSLIHQISRTKFPKTFLSPEDAMDALAEHIKKNCCWGKSPMEKMKVKSVEPSTAYKYLMNRSVL